MWLFSHGSTFPLLIFLPLLTFLFLLPSLLLQVSENYRNIKSVKSANIEAKAQGLRYFFNARESRRNFWPVGAPVTKCFEVKSVSQSQQILNLFLDHIAEQR